MNKKLLSPCGLYCGVCAIQGAHRDDDASLKKKLAKVYGVPVEEIACEGCRSEKLFSYCRVCPIRECAKERGLDGCHECNEFPCERISNFPFDAARKVMLRAVPLRKKHGTEKWVEKEMNRRRCPSCGQLVYRGSRRCRNCKTPVGAD